MNSHESKIRVRTTISDWIKQKRGFAETDDWDKGDLIKTLIIHLLNISEEQEDYHARLGKLISNSVINNHLAKFLKKVRTSANISDIKIPVNIYSGDSAKLPEIFELLNSSGVVLSKYEIYAARWLDTKLNIKNKKIKEAIRDKYVRLSDEGFTVEALEQESDPNDGESYPYTPI